MPWFALSIEAVHRAGVRRWCQRVGGRPRSRTDSPSDRACGPARVSQQVQQRVVHRPQRGVELGGQVPAEQIAPDRAVAAGSAMTTSRTSRCIRQRASSHRSRRRTGRTAQLAASSARTQRTGWLRCGLRLVRQGPVPPAVVADRRTRRSSSTVLVDLGQLGPGGSRLAIRSRSTVGARRASSLAPQAEGAHARTHARSRTARRSLPRARTAQQAPHHVRAGHPAAAA